MATTQKLKQQKIDMKYKVPKADNEHHQYTINDVEVYFPYELYDCQYNYILNVLNALKKKQNALLESPTGTGKTLCLLCASISFVVDVLQKKGYYDESVNITNGGEKTTVEFPKNVKIDIKPHKNIPKIIFASRTHSQLKQVIKELKNVYFIKNNEKYKLLTTLLGSRDQLCIHSISNVYKGSALNHMCKKERKSGGCTYHNGIKYLDQLKHLFMTPMDVETLNSNGKGNTIGQNIKFCPFYATREIQDDCHIILLPYNYLFDEATRKILKLDLENSIIIIDEGHNIESVAENAVSFRLRDADLNLFQEAIKNTINVYNNVKGADSEGVKNLDINEVFSLSRSMKALLEWLLSENLEKNPKNRIKECHKSYYGKEIFDIFERNNINIDKSNFEKIDELMSNVIELFNKYINDVKLSQMDIVVIHKYIGCIDNIRKSLGILFSDIVRNCIEYFQLYVAEEPIPFSESEDVTKVYDKMKKYEKKKTKISYNKDSTTNEKSISLLCFSATASLCGILKKKVNSIIITSGTLSPIVPFSKQLGGKYFEFENILENDHVIKSHQLFVGCIPSYNNQALLATYENRNNMNYLKALGDCVFDLIVCIPFGVLIFFASYGSMAETIKTWKKLNIYDKINAYKKIFIEPNKASDLKPILDEYEYEIKTRKKGAIFIGVCRGKISEGIDFKDDSCRGVLICGLPYGNVNDSKIIFKKEFLDNFDPDENTETSSTSGGKTNRGNNWYNEEAMRAINQSIGRVIRHRNDYGAIVFLDARFANQNRVRDISKWVRTHFRIYKNIEQMQSDIDKFFELLKTMNTKEGTKLGTDAATNKNKYKPLEQTVGKNFQDCYVKQEEKMKNAKNKEMEERNRFVYNPPKRSKNETYITSMIYNITKGEPEKNRTNETTDTNGEKKLCNVGGGGAAGGAGGESSATESNVQKENKTNKVSEEAKAFIAELKQVLSEKSYSEFVTLVKKSKEMDTNVRYKHIVTNTVQIFAQHFQLENEQKGITTKKKETEDEQLNYSDMMNEAQLSLIWEKLVKLINTFIPQDHRDKGFSALQKIFKEKATNFNEMDKYVFNFKNGSVETL